MGRQTRLAAVVAVVLIAFGSQQAVGQVLTGSGPCPGVKTFNVTGATPNTRLAFIHAQNTGGWVIPSGLPCFGTVTGLMAPVVLAGFASADGFGAATVSAFVPAGFCGNRYLQVVDMMPCTTSNVLLIN